MSFPLRAFGASSARGTPDNPVHVPVPKPIYPLSVTEKKIYARMLADRRELERKYKLEVEIEGTHAKSQEGLALTRLGSSYGNYFYAEGPVELIASPTRQTVELKALAPWYGNGRPFSLYCKGSPDPRAFGKCMDLPPGRYLARKSKGRRDVDGAISTRVEIPMVVRDDVYVGGIYKEKIVKVTYDLLPFNPDRFRK